MSLGAEQDRRLTFAEVKLGVRRDADRHIEARSARLHDSQRLRVHIACTTASSESPSRCAYLKRGRRVASCRFAASSTWPLPDSLRQQRHPHTVTSAAAVASSSSEAFA